MRDEIGGVLIKVLFALKPRVYSFLVDDSTEHKKSKDAKRNVVVTRSHGEYKHVLLNKKCLRQSKNRKFISIFVLIKAVFLSSYKSITFGLTTTF